MPRIADNDLLSRDKARGSGGARVVVTAVTARATAILIASAGGGGDPYGGPILGAVAFFAPYASGGGHVRVAAVGRSRILKIDFKIFFFTRELFEPLDFKRLFNSTRRRIKYYHRIGPAYTTLLFTSLKNI